MKKTARLERSSLARIARVTRDRWHRILLFTLGFKLKKCLKTSSYEILLSEKKQKINYSLEAKDSAKPSQGLCEAGHKNFGHKKAQRAQKGKEFY